MVPSISQTALKQVLVGVICITAVSVGAATLNAAEPIGASDNQMINPPSPGDDVIDPDVNASETGEQTDPNAGSSSFASVTRCVGFLDSTLGTVSVLVGVLALTGLIYFRYNLAISMFAGWTIAPPVALAYFMLTDCGGGGPTYGGGGGIGGLDSAGETIVPVMDLPPWLMAVLIGGALVTAVAVLYRTAGEDEIAVVQEDGDDDEDPELDEFAEAAGRAADRIENRNVDVDNAVYEAWVEMTELLDVERPETYAPEEFAEEAIGLGMDAPDVTELTRLFNEVRYGDRDAAKREDRALEVLRNIESAYSTVTPDRQDIAGGDEQ
ncbi:DUF4129 domain-containing protein [Halomontanus rarus]|uniref:DUF4129 domain-containing protein n=1 Tax=Halomontanus rarus TaxID=3034020 RepID=UPI0023E764DB|nr:DUF4129 domain-containing protein [Halovivax sp. TS33]